MRVTVPPASRSTSCPASRFRTALNNCRIDSGFFGANGNALTSLTSARAATSPSPCVIAVPGITLSRYGVSRSAANASDVGPSFHIGMIVGS